MNDYENRKGVEKYHMKIFNILKIIICGNVTIDLLMVIQVMYVFYECRLLLEIKGLLIVTVIAQLRHMTKMYKVFFQMVYFLRECVLWNFLYF